jgi:LPS sulfotransferase NodH
MRARYEPPALLICTACRLIGACGGETLFVAGYRPRSAPLARARDISHSETMADKRVICVLSNPRSGSTALRSALSASGVIRDFGEIFHNDRALTSFPFLDYLERRSDPLSTILDYDGCEEISYAYLHQLGFETQGLRALIDIKHNSWGVLRPLWQYPHDEPLFLSALKAEQAIFIQLARQSLADQVISYYVATNTQVWHAQLQTDDIPRNILGRSLEPALARRLCFLFERAERLTDSFLADYPYCISLTYETIFSDGALTVQAAVQLGEALGAPVRSTLLPMKRNMVAKQEIVSNYEQICEIAEAVRAACRAS